MLISLRWNRKILSTLKWKWNKGPINGKQSILVIKYWGICQNRWNWWENASVDAIVMKIRSGVKMHSKRKAWGYVRHGFITIMVQRHQIKITLMQDCVSLSCPLDTEGVVEYHVLQQHWKASFRTVRTDVRSSTNAERCPWLSFLPLCWAKGKLGSAFLENVLANHAVKSQVPSLGFQLWDRAWKFIISFICLVMMPPCGIAGYQGGWLCNGGPLALYSTSQCWWEAFRRKTFLCYPHVPKKEKK